MPPNDGGVEKFLDDQPGSRNGSDYIRFCVVTEQALSCHVEQTWHIP
jgi:hypothetical protein